MTNLYTIKTVAQRTGLTPHAIRAWERRYAALSPDRTPTNRRLYSEEDVEKLRLLHRAVRAGYSIGQIARLSIPELRALDVSAVAGEVALPGDDGPSDTPPARLLDASREAIERLDAGALTETLTRGAADLGVNALLEQVAMPLLGWIGDHWRAGSVRTAQEHLASAVLRTFLGRLVASAAPSDNAPLLLATTPAGQMHEFGSLASAVTAVTEGWRVLYLGPNLPAEEIAGAARRSGARAIVLSLLYPPDDPRLPDELLDLRRGLEDTTALLVGGRAAPSYRRALEAAGAVLLEDLGALRACLAALRE